MLQNFYRDAKLCGPPIRQPSNYQQSHISTNFTEYGICSNNTDRHGNIGLDNLSIMDVLTFIYRRYNSIPSRCSRKKD